MKWSPTGERRLSQEVLVIRFPNGDAEIYAGSVPSKGDRLTRGGREWIVMRIDVHRAGKTIVSVIPVAVQRDEAGGSRTNSSLPPRANRSAMTGVWLAAGAFFAVMLLVLLLAAALGVRKPSIPATPARAGMPAAVVLTPYSESRGEARLRARRRRSRGGTHQAAKPLCARKAASPSPSATPTATRQSSPTTKSHQKAMNARTYLTRLRRPSR